MPATKKRTRGRTRKTSGPAPSLSDKAFAEAARCIPGGVNSPVRAFKAVGGQPLFMAQGKGAVLTDIDGREYLDYVGSWGPHLLGHAHPAVVRAVKSAAESSTSFGAPTLSETLLCELIVSAFPAMEKVRLVNSGTEACMTAVRLARGFFRATGKPGRDLIVKFAGCYHGHADSLLVDAGSGALTFGNASSAGVPKDVAALTIVLPYNDVGAVEACFKKHGKRVAGIIVEPVVGNMGCVRPMRGFLEALRAITSHYDSLLIFDEVMTGFRVAWGGVQTLYGIAPDITTLGKVVGGGLPLAAVGGRAHMMDKLAPLGPVYQAGTLSGNPVAVAAGLAALSTIRKDANIYRRLEILSARLAFGLDEAIKGGDVPAYVARFGSMLTLFFTRGRVSNLSDAMRSDTAAFARFHRAMLERGVYLPASQFEAWFVSAAHTFEHIDATIAAARDALHSKD